MRFQSKVQIIALFLFLPLFLRAEKALVIGVMKNASAGERIELLVHHYFLDGKSDTEHTYIEAANQFTLEADIVEPQYVFLKFHSNYLPIYLEPNDTVFVETDLLQFPMVAKFSGKGGGNNEFLSQFLKEYPINFNEFSKVRYKIGEEWCTMDTEVDQRMNRFKPEDFKAQEDKKSAEQLADLDAFIYNNPNKTSKTFYDYLVAEILYTRAYNLLFYGEIYKNMHGIEPSFFEILYDVAPHCQVVGSPAYRRYLMAYMAHRVKLSKSTESIFQQEYLSSSDLLSDKSLAFYRSEIIFNALKQEKYEEVLPFYTSFLESNILDDYEEKVANEYEHAVRVSPGAMAPDFSGIDQTGNSHALSEMRGKVVYLNFWASYCGSCIKKIGALNSFKAELDKAGVQIINISIDKSEEAWHSSVVENNVQGVNFLSQRVDANLAESYSVEAIPQYFIIGKNGSFAAKPHTGKLSDLKDRLIELANKQ